MYLFFFVFLLKKKKKLQKNCRACKKILYEKRKKESGMGMRFAHGLFVAHLIRKFLAIFGSEF